MRDRTLFHFLFDPALRWADVVCLDCGLADLEAGTLTSPLFMRSLGALLPAQGILRFPDVIEMQKAPGNENVKREDGGQ
jgi:hypothetical protein